MAESSEKSSGYLVYSNTEASLDLLSFSLSQFSDSHKSSLSKSDMQKKIDEISKWVEKQKKRVSSVEKAKDDIQNVSRVITATVSGLQKLQSGDAVSGTLEIISSVAMFAGEAMGGPAGAALGVAIGALCSIIGAIFTANKSKQPSIVEQVAEVVHKKLVHFNKKLKDQKYDGLKRRVSDQAAQLQTMKKGDKLDDPNLWNDYVQFMGELGNRIQSPLPFKDGHRSSTKDPDVADFVRAVMTYCRAYSCFMALLVTAKGRFADLGSEHKEDEDKVDRKISRQTEDAKEKLAFLFDEKYLTFLGRLPSEGGKLTKIVVFSRNAKARRLVKMVTKEFGLPEMPDSKRIESNAELVSRQYVQSKTEGHPDFRRPACQIQFINETKFPLKIISGTVGNRVRQLDRFTQVVQPRSCYETLRDPFRVPAGVSIGGYIIVYLDEKLRSDDEPDDADMTPVIEFALCNLWFTQPSKVNIQDKSGTEFTRGKDTYYKMKDGETKTIYWTTNGTHYMARAELYVHSTPAAGPAGDMARTQQTKWRFVVQDFDPVRDVRSQQTACLLI